MLLNENSMIPKLHYIYASSRHFYPKWHSSNHIATYLASRYYIILWPCVNGTCLRSKVRVHYNAHNEHQIQMLSQCFIWNKMETLSLFLWHVETSASLVCARFSLSLSTEVAVYQSVWPLFRKSTGMNSTVKNAGMMKRRANRWPLLSMRPLCVKYAVFIERCGWFIHRRCKGRVNICRESTFCLLWEWYHDAAEKIPHLSFEFHHETLSAWCLSFFFS